MLANHLVRYQCTAAWEIECAIYLGHRPPELAANVGSTHIRPYLGISGCATVLWSERLQKSVNSAINPRCQHLSVENQDLEERIHKQNPVGLNWTGVQKNWFRRTIEAVAVQKRLNHYEGLGQVLSHQHMPKNTLFIKNTRIRCSLCNSTCKMKFHPASYWTPAKTAIVANGT